MTAPEGEKPLAGLRVVEVAPCVAVPAAGAMLVDLGAEVVKIEPPRGSRRSARRSRSRVRRSVPTVRRRG